MAISDEEAASYIEAGGTILGGVISIFSPPAGAVVAAGGKVAGKIYRDEMKSNRREEAKGVNAPNPLGNEKDDAPLPNSPSEDVVIVEDGVMESFKPSGSIFRLANSIF